MRPAAVGGVVVLLKNVRGTGGERNERARKPLEEWKISEMQSRR